MGIAEDLLEKIYTWIREREKSADNFVELARELETIRERCNTAECFGNTASVVGAASLIGAGAATLLTGGLAAPILGLVGATYTAVGVAVTVGTKITEHFVSSGPMKKAEEIEKTSNTLAQEIQRMSERLKEQIKRENPKADPDQLDQLFMTEIVKAVARRYSIDVQMNLIYFDLNDHLQTTLNLHRGMEKVFVEVAGVLAFFAFKVSGKKSVILFAQGVKQLAKELSSTAFKTAFKGGAMVVGGAVGMAFALPEAIDSWKEMIKKNHVTEASQSLRDTAKEIRKMTKTLRNQLDAIKNWLKEMARRQQEEKKKEEKMKQEKMKLEKMLEKMKLEKMKEEQKKQEEKMKREKMKEEQKKQEEKMKQEKMKLEKMKEEQKKQKKMKQEKMQEKMKREKITKMNPKSCKLGPLGLMNVWSVLVVVVVAAVYLSSGWRRSESQKEPEAVTRTGPLRIGLLKNPSENDQMSRILEMVSKNDLDIFLTMGTSIKQETAYEVLQQISPENFSFYFQAEKDGMDGVTVHFSDQLQEDLLVPDVVTTFQCVLLELKRPDWKQSLLLITVHQSATSSLTQFLTELQELLDQVLDCYDSVMLSGDFQQETSSSDQFEKLLQTNQLVQHEENSVFSRNVEISHLSADADANSRQCVTFHANIEPIAVTRTGPLRIGLLKNPSENDQMSRILEMVSKNDLDIFLTMGTSIKQETAYEVLQQISPENFSFYFQAEKDGMDGVTVHFSDQLQEDLLVPDVVTTFQCVLLELKRPDWKQSLLLITVHQSATSSLTQFLTELQELLDQVLDCYDSVMLSGDFQQETSSSDQFEKLLKTNQLVQHEENSVFSRNVEISHPSADADTNSRQYVTFKAKPQSKNTSGDN
ncbi:unnamed protein product [Ophioblennius macclurei]